MSRKEELQKIVNTNADDKILFEDLIDEILFIENKLVELKKLPFISVNPRNNQQQRSTAAAKQYKEFLQQYTNCLKIIARSSGQNLDDSESPLRAWVNKKIKEGD